MDCREQSIEIKIKKDGDVVWINGPDGCLLRVCGITNLTVLDDRPKSPRVMVDAVVEEPDGSIILIRRKNSPYTDCWALPGGKMEAGETLEQAIIREVKEEIGVTVVIDRLIGIYSDPARDPREPTVSVAFLCHKMDPTESVTAGSDAEHVQCFSRHEIVNKVQFAFDHAIIVEQAWDHLNKLTEKCPECLRKNCQCHLIKQMKEKGWRVENRGGYRIYTPDGRRYNVTYAEEARAWNFAVRMYNNQKAD